MLSREQLNDRKDREKPDRVGGSGEATREPLTPNFRGVMVSERRIVSGLKARTLTAAPWGPTEIRRWDNAMELQRAKRMCKVRIQRWRDGREGRSGKLKCRMLRGMGTSIWLGMFDLDIRTPCIPF